MNRADYDRYVQAFNDRDYDTVFDFYAPGASIRFFGVELGTREAFQLFNPTSNREKCLLAARMVFAFVSTMEAIPSHSLVSGLYHQIARSPSRPSGTSIKSSY